MADSDDDADLCRVCQSKGTPSKPLFHPCICSGSIKYTHNDCLIRWLSHSKKELCELCNHHIKFSTIYAHGMPNRLPVKDVLGFIFMIIMKKIVIDVRSSLVMSVWLYLVPFIEWRLHLCMFNGTFDPLTSLLRLPFDISLLHYIFDDLINGLPTIFFTIIYFCVLLVINREVMLSYEDDIIRPFYEHPLWIRLFPRDVEEEDDEEDVNRNGMKLFISKLNGSKGPLVFLRHVILILLVYTSALFWLLCCPYLIGKLAITAMTLQDVVLALHFEGLLTILFGYCLIAMFLFAMHTVATFIGLGSYKRIIWHYYTIIKVCILMVVWVSVIPFLTALWMDICSLSMFDISIKERIRNFYDSPESFVFLHWLTGLISLIAFFPIFEVFHKIARPGLLWFLKNLINYTDWFDWTEEMIKENMFRHCRKIIISTTLYGTVIFVLVWIPTRIVRCVLPSFLPYTAPMEGYYLDEWSLLIRLLLVSMVKQDDIQRWAETGVRFWCVNVSRMLGMESYLLLGDAAPREADGGTPAAQPYVRPTNLVPRLFALLVLAILTASAVGLLAITVPVGAIRLAMSLLAAWLPAVPSARPYRQMYVNDICLTLINMFLCHICADFAYPLLREVLSGARAAAASCLKLFSEHPSRASVASAGLLFVAPRLFAALFHLVVVVPSAVPAHQSPVIPEMQGVVFRLCCAGLSVLLFVFAPACPLGRAYADGLANFRLAKYRLAARHVAVPTACAISLLLAVPYMIAYSAVPFLIGCRRAMSSIPLITFPLLMAAPFIIKTMMIMFDVYMSTEQRILDDKYALRKELVNYDPKLATAKR